MMRMLRITSRCTAALAVMLCSSTVYAQQQPAPSLQQTIFQRQSEYAGGMALNNVALVAQLDATNSQLLQTQAQLAQAQARIRELEAKLPKETPQ